MRKAVMSHMVTHPGKSIAALASFRALLVFVPISLMKLMPESDWFWRGLLVMLLLALTAELFISAHRFRGWRCVFAMGGSLGFTLVGLPFVAFFAFLLSLVIGTFEFPPM